MNTKEVLVRLKISRPTLNKYIDQGLIKATKQFNGRYVFNDDEIIGLSENLKVIDRAQSSLIHESPIEEPKKSDKTLDQELVKNINKALFNCLEVFDELEKFRILTPKAVSAKTELKNALEKIK